MTPVPVRPVRLPGLEDAPHALPYQGSKRQLAHCIVPLLPADTARVLEPFAGSAAVTIAARYMKVGAAAQISDINAPLMNLWDAILSEPHTLADDYERLWKEQLDDPRAFYEVARSCFNSTHEPQYLLYLLARCVKAAVRYNRDGQFNQSADHRRLGAKPATMRARLLGTSRTLAGTQSAATDYADILVNADKNDVVYMDPPYQGVTNTRDHRYMAGLERNEFAHGLQRSVDRDVSFILSYDGISGGKRYGEPMPDELGLLHLHVYAGKSSQATLNGIDADTVESLYLSPALVRRLGGEESAIGLVSGTGGQAGSPPRRKASFRLATS